MSMDDSTLLYVLTQLQDATVDITAESKESRDKDGTLIKKFWTGKSGKIIAAWISDNSWKVSENGENLSQLLVVDMVTLWQAF